MSLPHFYLPGAKELKAEYRLQLEVGQRIDGLFAQNVEFWRHVKALRLKSGDHIVLVDCPGHAWEMLLVSTPGRSSQGISATALKELSQTRSQQITLVQAISIGERMEQTVRQTTELGVNRIIPLLSERSTVRLNKETGLVKRQRWQRIAYAAAEQSCQLEAPEVTVPLTLSEALSEVAPCDSTILFWEEAELSSRPFIESFLDLLSGLKPKQKQQKIAVFIGPEGGFSPFEAKTIQASGAQTASLGSTILRTETAAVVAVALVSQCLAVRKR